MMAEVLLVSTASRSGSARSKPTLDISMKVHRGDKIIALLGENGAGKSTLVKQIFGLITPDSGTITVKGDPTRIKDPKDAIGRGIGMVHQHFRLVPVMTVTENIILGFEPVKGLNLDLDSARTMVVEASDRYGLEVDPDAAIEDLPVGTQQRVEILKALSKKVDLLILDEPTAVLTPQETDEPPWGDEGAGRRRHVDRLHHAPACVRCSPWPTGSTSCAKAASSARSRRRTRTRPVWPR